MGLQHDLRLMEFRDKDNSQLYGWCICGLWTYQSAILNQAHMTEAFMGHLRIIEA